jgi:Major Facilitator Superfamily
MDEHNACAARRWNPAWTLAVASLALMMAFLDSLVVTTALPTLRVSLHTSLTTLEWTVNAYNLSFACLLLTGAALGDRFGRRRMLCAGLAIFTGASLPRPSRARRARQRKAQNYRLPPSSSRPAVMPHPRQDRRTRWTSAGMAAMP